LKFLFITTHPIQYNAPLFSYLSRFSNYRIKVFYTLGKNKNESIDNGFGVIENWNIDLLSGYDSEFIENTSSRPSSNTFWGIKNPTLLNRIRFYKPDFIIVFGWRHYSHFSVLHYYHKKIPIIFRGDSTTLDDSLAFPFRSFFRYAFLKMIYSKVDYVLSPGSASDAYFIKSGIQDANIIRAVHAVDNFRFSQFSQDDEQLLDALKDKLAITTHNIVFLFAGKFIAKKNPLFLIKAFSQIAIQQQNVRLVIVGNGILESLMRQQINNLVDSIKCRIHLFPFQDQQSIKVFYRLANLYILPSKGPGETWGLSVNEALASGTPVLVSSQCGCAQDIIQDGINGYTFKSENIHDLEAKMMLCCNEKHLNQLAKNAAQSVSVYSFQSIKESFDRIITLYEN
jgi:glycosyltransferase involved in cell wall biosynthesis